MQFLVEATGRRADWMRNALRFAWQVMSRSTWAMLTAPKKGATWKHLAADLGLSERTVANLYAWFIKAGLLARAVPGTTVRFRKGTRCGLDDDGRGNEAAQYLLVIPTAILKADEDDPSQPATVTPASEEEVPWPCETVPTRPHLELVSDVSAGSAPVDGSCTPKPSHLAVGEETSRNARARRRTAPATPASEWPATVTPVTKKDRLAACDRLIHELPLFRRLSARHLRSVLRPAFELGATISDIRHALDHRPDGSPWIHTHDPRWLPSWIRHRLSAWITPDGQLVTPWPIQQRAAEHTALLAEQHARRNAYERANQARLGGPISYSERWTR
ncbi:hypothetical protein [Nonomuraea angiospora]